MPQPQTPPSTSAAPDSVVTRIRRLLALQQSDNEHEASMAGAEVQRLLLLHNITLVMAQESARTHAVFHQESVQYSSSLGSWYASLAFGVAQVMGIQAIKEVQRDGVPTTVMLYGTPENVAASRALLEWLVLEVERLSNRDWVKAKEAGARSANGWKCAYRLGCASGIVRRLSEAHAATRAEVAATDDAGRSTQALVLLHKQDDELLEKIRASLGQRGLRLTRSSRPQPADTSAMIAGSSAADEVDLQTPQRALRPSVARV